jgi:hypothetical protein
MTNLLGADDERGAPDRPCANCGHAGHDHVVREIEVPGNTVRETYCEECVAICQFVPESDSR